MKYSNNLKIKVINIKLLKYFIYTLSRNLLIKYIKVPSKYYFMKQKGLSRSNFRTSPPIDIALQCYIIVTCAIVTYATKITAMER